MHYVKYIEVCLLSTGVALTSWRILKNPSVIIVSRNDLQFCFGDGFTDGAASDHFYFTGVVLASLWDVHVVHAVVGKLVARSVSNCVTVDQPHDTWSRMSSHPAAEPGPITFLNGARFRPTDEDWSGARFALLASFLRYPTRFSIKFVPNTNESNLHLPSGLQFSDLFNTLHTFR